MRLASWSGCVVLGCLIAAPSPAGEPDGSRGRVPDATAAERGRVALTLRGFLKPEWSDAAYRRAARLWDQPAPDPDSDPAGYAAAFRYRYGLHPAPYPNDGLPMGLRRGIGRDGVKTGLQIDCMVCHGGSIGGKSYVGLGNTQLDLQAPAQRADDRRRPATAPLDLHPQLSRGTNNAGHGRRRACSASAIRTSRSATFPLPLGVNLPEMDTPAWWHLKRKRTMYYDGRTDARSVRTNMQFMLGEKSLEDFKELEPTFRDFRAFFLSLEPPKYPFPIDSAQAARGQVVFEETCARCHGTYGPDGKYPNKIVPLDVIGTDPARSNGLSDRLVAHYNSTWLGAEYPVNTETGRLPGPAARRHLGHRPVPAQRLGPDPARPARVVDPAPAFHPPALDRLRALRHDPCRLEVHRGLRRGAGLDRPPLAVPGQVHRRHRAASAWATAAIPSAMTSPKRADGPDRVLEDAVSPSIPPRCSGLISSTSGRVVARSRLATCPAWRKARSTLPPRILCTSASE